MKGEKMGIIDFRYEMLFGFVGFALLEEDFETLVGMYFATGVLDPRFPTVIGAGFFAGGFAGSINIKKEKKEKQTSSFLLL